MKHCQWSVKCSVILLCLLSVLISRRSCAAETNDLRSQFEKITTNIQHFSLTVIVRNGGLRLPSRSVELPASYHALESFQTSLLRTLQRVSHERDALASLLKHPDPKVRTLALGAVFQREDGRDLPLIASLLEDNARTFNDLHDSFETSGAFSMKYIEETQTVGDVASEMLALWDVPGSGSRSSDYYLYKPVIKTKDFREYWEKHEGFASSALHFKMKFQRATRLSSSLEPRYFADIFTTFSDLNEMPQTNRAWTALYVHAHLHAPVIPEDQLLTDLKAVGPIALGRFLARQNVSGDPGLRFGDPEEHDHVGMMWFILHHAAELLRPENSSMLLSQAALGPQAVSFRWYAAAAEATYSSSPAEARKIINDAMKRYPLINKKGGREQAFLQSALWRMEGIKARRELVDWFFIAQQKALDEQLSAMSGSDHGPAAFLWTVDEDRRSDTPKLLKAIVSDKRFAKSEQVVLEQLAKMAGLVDRDRFWPLATEEEWNKGMEQRSSPANLDKWRDRLRKHEFESVWKPLPRKSILNLP